MKGIAESACLLGQALVGLLSGSWTYQLANSSVVGTFGCLLIRDDSLALLLTGYEKSHIRVALDRGDGESIDSERFRVIDQLGLCAPPFILIALSESPASAARLIEGDFLELAASERQRVNDLMRVHEAKSLPNRALVEAFVEYSGFRTAEQHEDEPLLVMASGDGFGLRASAADSRLNVRISLSHVSQIQRVAAALRRALMKRYRYLGDGESLSGASADKWAAMIRNLVERPLREAYSAIDHDGDFEGSYDFESWRDENQGAKAYFSLWGTDPAIYIVAGVRELVFVCKDREP